MKSKDGHVTMPTEDHHGNTSVKVHGLVLISMIIKCCHGNKGWSTTGRYNIS